MNPFKAVTGAWHSLIFAIKRLTNAINALADEIEERNEAENHGEPAKATNGVHAAPRTKAKA
jgi:hypothetical protein